MKSVLISIQPYWVFLIIAKAMGWKIDKEKTIEVRKNFPKAEDWNKLVEIYCSKDKKSFNQIPKKYQPLMQKFLGKVIGEFVCEKIDNYECELWNDEAYELIRQFNYDEYGETEYEHGAENNENCEMLNKACLTWQDIRKYLGQGLNNCYAWHISDLKIYDKPKELSEFKVECPTKNQINGDCNFCKYMKFSYYGKHPKCNAYLKRPPQSWCYVESGVQCE